MLILLCFMVLLIVISAYLLFTTIGWSLVVIVFIVFSVVTYLVGSQAKKRVFELFGTCRPWIARIPLFSTYMLGKTCNGLDGRNAGIFNLRVPNWLYNFGWLISLATKVAGIFVGWSTALGVVLIVLPHTVIFVYRSSLYAFLFSRVDRVDEHAVRKVAIVSSFIHIVAYCKLLSASTNTVYSHDNDRFYVEPRQLPIKNKGDREGV